MGKATPHEPNRKLAQAKCRHDVSNVACSLYILPTTVLLHVLGSPYVIGGPGSRAWGKASEPLEGYIGSLGATTSTLPHNLPGREDESARRKLLWIAPSLCTPTDAVCQLEEKQKQPVWAVAGLGPEWRVETEFCAASRLSAAGDALCTTACARAVQPRLRNSTTPGNRNENKRAQPPNKKAQTEHHYDATKWDEKFHPTEQAQPNMSACATRVKVQHDGVRARWSNYFRPLKRRTRKRRRSSTMTVEVKCVRCSTA